MRDDFIITQDWVDILDEVDYDVVVMLQNGSEVAFFWNMRSAQVPFLASGRKDVVALPGRFDPVAAKQIEAVSLYWLEDSQLAQF